jgi:hypothetical protein
MECILRSLKKSLGSAPNPARIGATSTRGSSLPPSGEGRKLVAVAKKQSVFSQGDAADAVFYIQQGKVRLTCLRP